MVFVELMASIVTLALTAVFVPWEGMSLKSVGIGWNATTWMRLVAGGAIGFAMVALQTLVVAGLGHVRWVRSPEPVATSTAVAALAFLLVALREEPAFHGYPLRGLDRTFGAWQAQLIVALIFALEHYAGGMTLWQSLWGPGVGSLVFGLAALTTRGLALPVGLHAGWDFTQWLLGYRDASGLWHPVVGKGFEHRADEAGMIGYLIAMTLTMVVLWRWRPVLEHADS
jgi:membrane protease YdiL (CAAX protease family)